MTDHIENTGMAEESILYKTRPGIVLTSVGPRFFLVTSSNSIELSECAGFYWKMMEKGASEEELLNAAALRYEEGDAAVVHRDLDLFIRACLKRGLIEAGGDR